MNNFGNHWVEKAGLKNVQLVLVLSLIAYSISILITSDQVGVSKYIRFLILLPLFVTGVTRRFDLFFSAFRSWLVWLFFGLQVVLWSFNIYREYYSLHFNYYDTGFFWNPISNFAAGKGFYNSEIQASEFADHFCPGLLVFSPLASWFHDGTVLIVIRLLGYIFSFWLLHRLLRFLEVETGLSNFILFAWITSMGLVNFMGFEFQSSNLIVPLIFALFLSWQKKQWWISGLLMLGILSLKENGALVILSLGMFSFFYLNQRWQGIVLVVSGTFLFWFIPVVLMPYLAGTANLNTTSILLFADPYAKARFAFQVFLCTGLLLFFHPKALLVVLPSMAVSFLLNRSGAQTMAFHYQDIPLAVSFAVIGFLASKARGGVSGLIPSFPGATILATFGIIVGMYANKYSVTNFLVYHTPTENTKAAVEAMHRFRKEHIQGKTLYAQPDLAYYDSGNPAIRCLMNADVALSDTLPNYIVLCDASENHWPIGDGYESFKSHLLQETAAGKRKQRIEYLPLLVFEK